MTECGTPSVDTGAGTPRTGHALAAALARHGLTERGTAWLGKLAAVGGRRDTLVYVPHALDPTRTVELVIYMEGHGSFADAAMDHRHASSIARLLDRGGNVVYVAPDAPSSAHGDPTARTPYWQAGCADRRCAGGHAAPGDFVVFVATAVARAAAMACVEADALDVRLHLIGFSNGGKGVWGAVGQLAAVNPDGARRAVRVGDVVFADGNYGAAWLDETWARLAARPEAPRLTILVGDGSFTRPDRAGGNRRRAAAFWRRAAGQTPAPAAGRPIDAPGLRLVPLRGGHHAIGDAAVDYLTIGDDPPST